MKRDIKIIVKEYPKDGKAEKIYPHDRTIREQEITIDVEDGQYAEVQCDGFEVGTIE